MAIAWVSVQILEDVICSLVDECVNAAMKQKSIPMEKSRYFVCHFRYESNGLFLKKKGK